MTAAANQPYDTEKGPPVNAKCDRCEKPAHIIFPDFALCEVHGKAVIDYLDSMEKP